MNAIIGPLGDLAGEVKKWNGVSVPSTLKTSLADLSAGVKSFTWAFVGGWSMSAIIGPLGKLAGAVSKWKDVSVPGNIKTGLTTLSEGIKSFTLAFIGARSLSKMAGPLGTLADSVKKWKGVTIPEGIGDDLKELAGGIKSFKTFNSGSITTVTESFDKIASSISKTALMVANKRNAFMSAGSKLSSALVSGVSRHSGKIRSSILKSLSSVVTSINSYYVHFHRSGEYLVTGFANGISANTYKAEAKARAMASAAKQAAKDELKEKSPSKEGYEIGDYFGVGFVNGIGNNVHTAFSVGAEMAKSAKNGLNATVDKLRKLIDTDMNLEPTIKPMLDLSNIKSGAGSIGSMIGNPSLEVMSNVGSISMMMNRQNGVNDDIISALNKLRGDLGNIGGDTYIVDGVVYDDGTNVSDAVRTLVRAAKIERRR